MKENELSRLTNDHNELKSDNRNKTQKTKRLVTNVLIKKRVVFVGMC